MDEKILKFKEKLAEDNEFRQLFVNAFNLDEIVDIARENGIDLNLDEIMEDPELSDQFLEAIAGGVTKTAAENDTYTYMVIGNNNFFFEASSKEEAQKYANKFVDELQKKGGCQPNN